jgi:type IV pilus assembly protein PilF
LNNAGICSLKLKNEPAAEKYFLQAFQIDPRNPVTNVHLAKIYFDRKDYERARFYIGRVPQADELNADVLWLAIKVHHQLGDRDAETSLVTQLRKRHPDSPEYAAFRRGAFDE